MPEGTRVGDNMRSEGTHPEKRKGGLLKKKEVGRGGSQAVIG